jgi:hypothetical protein
MNANARDNAVIRAAPNSFATADALAIFHLMVMSLNSP